MANPDIGALQNQWWADWRAADYSWDGLAGKSFEHRGARLSLQNYWGDEAKRLINEPGTARRWTRFHCPFVFADGTPSPKAHWSDADWAEVERAALMEIGLDVPIVLSGAVLRSLVLPAIADAAHARGGLHLILSQAWMGGDLGLDPAPGQAAALDIDASGAWIGGPLRCRGRVLSAGNFNGATVIGDSDFTRSIFQSEAHFTGVKFAGAADFSDAVFHNHAIFEQARFAGPADFFGVHFLGRALFDNAQCLDDIGFYKSAFVRRLTINDATFYGKVNLEGATDGDPIVSSPQLIRLTAQGTPLTALTGTLDPGVGPSASSFRSLPKLHARRATFYENANFSNRDMLSPSTFRSARFHERALFHGSDIHANVNFHGTRFREALHFTPKHLPKYPDDLLRLRFLNDGAGRDYAGWKKAYLKTRAVRRGDDFTADGYFDALETSFRTLKQLMEDRRDRVREGEFFNYELRARRKRSDVPWWERAASFIYWLISDYGNSIFRPLVTMVLLFVGLSLAYYALGDHLTRLVPLKLPHLFSAFGFSWGNVFSPFSVLDPQRFSSGSDSWVQSLVLTPDSAAAFRIKVLASAQSLLSLTLAFLAGLAGRRRFQIN